MQFVCAADTCEALDAIASPFIAAEERTSRKKKNELKLLCSRYVPSSVELLPLSTFAAADASDPPLKSIPDVVSDRHGDFIHVAALEIIPRKWGFNAIAKPNIVK